MSKARLRVRHDSIFDVIEVRPRFAYALHISAARLGHIPAGYKEPEDHFGAVRGAFLTN